MTPSEQSDNQVDITGAVADIDIMRGADERSIPVMEALARGHGENWTALYMIAKERGRIPAYDRDDGRTVAWIEGYLAGQRAYR